MEDWKYLLQKDGDRSWLPLKPPLVEIPEGRYRIVAHSGRTNTDVEVRIIHHCTDEVPPKRRTQKRSRRTNSEGLIAIVPFTHIKPGIWDLQAKSDIMSDMLGDTWQEAIKLRVLPTTETAPVISAPSVEETPLSTQSNLVVELSENAVAGEPNKLLNTEPVAVVDITPAEKVSDSSSTFVPIKSFSIKAQSLSQSSESQIQQKPESTIVEPQNQSLWWDRDRTDDSLPPSLDSELVVDKLEESDETSPITQHIIEGRRDAVSTSQPLIEIIDKREDTVPITQNLPKVDLPNGDLMAHSLQMAEQILQQLVNPVWQDIEPPAEASSSALPEQKPERQQTSVMPPLGSADRTLLLTLDEETLMARWGQPLNITGRVDILEVTQHGNFQKESKLNSVFEGELRYHLRDPQDLQVLVDDRLPICSQVPPFAFGFSFKLPPNCEIPLILGEVILYGKDAEAIAFHCFSITADVQELLGKILKKAPELTSEQTPTDALEPSSESPALNHKSAGLDLTLFDLVKAAKNPQPLKVSIGQPVPPQLNQPATKKATKPLQLPKLPGGDRYSSQLAATVAASLHNDSGQATLSESTKDESTGMKAVADLWEDEPKSDSSVVTSENWRVGLGLPLEIGNNEKREESQLPESTDGSSSPLGVKLEGDKSDRSEQSNSGDLMPTDSAEIASSPQLQVNEPETLIPKLIDTSINTVPEDLWASQINELPPTHTSAAALQISSASLEEQNNSAIDFGLPMWNFGLEFTGDGLKSSDRNQEPETTYPEKQPENLIAKTSTPKLFEDLVNNESPEIDDAFQALRVQERFWSRLNAMVADAELSECLKSELAIFHTPVEFEEEDWQLIASSEQDEPEEDTQQLEVVSPLELSNDSLDVPPLVESEDLTSHIESESEITTQIEAGSELTAADSELEVPILASSSVDWTTQEIVVDDFPEPEQLTRSSYAPEVKPALEAQIPVQMLEYVQVPTPNLSIPEGELIAGEQVAIWVKLPVVERTYVKLWIQDRQSRSLLDGPRSLMDFSPDGLGDQETMIQLTVPFGSLSIRFEAIAIDMSTQRESHKVTIDRVVIPPNLPILSLDEFDD